MTKTFCDCCGRDAAKAFVDVTLAVGERQKFKLRAIFEMVTQPTACGSLGLSSETTTTADICSECQLKLVEKLKLDIKTPL